MRRLFDGRIEGVWRDRALVAGVVGLLAAVFLWFSADALVFLFRFVFLASLGLFVFLVFRLVTALRDPEKKERLVQALGLNRRAVGREDKPENKQSGG